MDKTIAAVLENTGMPLVIKELTIPTLLPGQVLVKVLYSGVCRSQLMEVRGERGEDRWLPHLLGHEASGIVLDVGPGVTKVKLNDGVILTWIKGQGEDVPGGLFLDGDRQINSGPVTTFSHHTVVSENRVIVKPSSLAFDTAVLFGCALPTGAGMVINELDILHNQSVVIYGLGGVGISALLALLAMKVKTVIAIDLSEDKLIKAKEFGATHCVNAMTPNLVSTVSELTNGGADFCIESAGTVDSIEQGFALIHHGGKLLFASHPRSGDMIRLSPHELINGKKIAGSWGGGVFPDRDIPRIHTLFSNMTTSLNALLTKRYSLCQINDALDDLEAGRVFRPLIEMNHSN